MIHEEQVVKVLGPKEKQLFVALRRGHNRSIEDLYSTLWPGRFAGTRRLMQQRLGKVISTLNVHLAREDYRIVPGTPRGTYVLRSTI